MLRKFHERGLPVTPVHAGTKKAFLTDWQKVGVFGPVSDETIDLWEKRYPDCNVGLVLGPWTGICALDIDVMETPGILELCPPSPLIRVGQAPKQCRFFLAGPGVEAENITVGERKDSGGDDKIKYDQVQVLYQGQQIVIHGMHPDTKKPYYWATPDSFEHKDWRELPVLHLSDLEKIRARALPKRNGKAKRGRHDQMVAMVTAMIKKGKSLESMVQECLDYDRAAHCPSWFTDPSDFKETQDPHANAVWFVKSMQKSVPAPRLSLVSGQNQEGGAKVPQGFQPQSWPIPTGILGEICLLIQAHSVADQPGLALGGALALGSVLLSDRVRWGRTWPNLYVVNIAPTGAGKSFPYLVINQILRKESNLDLVGLGSYKSSVSIYSDLATRSHRLDLIDEAQRLFQLAGSTNSYQQDIFDELSNLWSASETIYRSPVAASRPSMVVAHPCVSVLFSSTPAGIQDSMNAEFLSHGFLPRCLLFAEGYGPERPPLAAPEVLEKAAHLLSGRLQALRNQWNSPERGSPPQSLAITAEAKKELETYQRAQIARVRDLRTPEIERPFLTRTGQLAAKLALIQGACRAGKIELVDVQWAIACVSAARHNAIPLMPFIAAESAYEIKLLKVIRALREAGGLLTQSQLLRRCRFVYARELKEILAALVEDGTLEAVEIPTAGRPAQGWVLREE